MHYTAYHLNIHSDLTLPELPPGQDSGVVDVNIQTQVAPASLALAESGGFEITVPDVATYRVTGGHSILVQPHAEADDASVRLFLLGSAFGALLHQRGHLVLHGNAVWVGDQCMVCVGHSGAGKSTLATAFLRRGHEVLADDVVPIDTRGHALPGFPRIKLWHDAAAHFGIATAGLHRIRPDLDKFNLPMTGAPSHALPVRWVYVLLPEDRPDIEVQPVRGMACFAPLMQNTYRAHYLSALQMEARHLQLCGQLAGQIRLAHVRRPTSRMCVDELAEHLLADMEAHP